MHAATLPATDHADDAILCDYASPFRTAADDIYVPGPAATAFVWPDQSQDDAVANDYTAAFAPEAMALNLTASVFSFTFVPVIYAAAQAEQAPAAKPVKAAPKPRARKRDFAFVR